MKTNVGNVSVEQIQNDIPIIEINDPYAYVTSNTVISCLVIKSPTGVQKRPLVRTKNDGYMT